MRVRMLSTQRGAVDPAGTVVQQHAKGEVYDLPDHLALVYLGAGYAEQADKPGPSEVQNAAPSELKEPVTDLPRHGGWPKGRPRK